MEKTRPGGNILEVLKGERKARRNVVKEESVDGRKAEGVVLVEKGSGMIGLESVEENREWSGIFNHVLKTARVATFLAEKLQSIGLPVEPKVVLNTILVSHCGRRQWDEARQYPQMIPNAEQKIKKGDTLISLGILQEAGVSEIIMDNVSAHDPFSKGDPFLTLDTWEKKLALYADFRVSQSVTSLNARFDNLQRAVDQGRITQDQLDQLRAWGDSVEKMIFSYFESEDLGKLLEPEDITDDYPAQPVWEKYIRRLYMQDAEKGIFDKLADYERRIIEAKTDAEVEEISREIEREFPESTWWGNYVKELYLKQNGNPNFETDTSGKLGMGRAIAFFGSLDVGQIYEDPLYSRLENK